MDWSRLLSTGISLVKRYRAQQHAQPKQAPQLADGYEGDWHKPLPPVNYAPRRNNSPDPGEVVWAWVPFEEDHSRGKDRPVLVLCEHPETPDTFLALPLTSKDHDRDADQERRAGRFWMDIGSGSWDRSGRESEVRLNRVLALRDDAVRREGASVDRDVFTRIVDAAREVNA